MAKKAPAHRTIFVPGLQGQFKLWKKEIAPACNRADAVVQMGNVVGCTDLAKDRADAGPNEAMLKYLVLFRSTQASWTQLIGPNEVMALNYPEEWTNARSRQILRNAWFDRANPTMVTATVDKGRLVTHGGLTYGEWRDLGSPATAAEAASLLNERYAATLYQGPAFNLGNAPNYAANPIWAHPLQEVYPSWVTAPVAPPFDQVHAETSLNSPLGREMLTSELSPLHHIDRAQFRNYGSIATIGGARFLGLHLDLPAEMVNYIPQPQALYLEKA